MNLTIGKLAQEYGLSRSTLLYYDKIGLLSPCSHRKGEYRTYGIEERERLKLICLYRKAGISLKEIKRILDNEETSTSTCLITRFKQLDREIAKLKEQQTVIKWQIGSSKCSGRYSTWLFSTRSIVGCRNRCSYIYIAIPGALSKLTCMG